MRVYSVKVKVSSALVMGAVGGPTLRRSTTSATQRAALADSPLEDLTLVPSARGELEITDVNNAYIREGTMSFSFLEGWWTDAGTFESLHRASTLVAKMRAEEESAAAAK